MEITGDRVTRLLESTSAPRDSLFGDTKIDLSGFLLLPGLVNAHDHLDFSLFPNLGNGPYGNYIEWGEDIHERFPDLIARHRAVPKSTRLWWGGIRNLLCGVTTVSHHNPLRPIMTTKGFPVRVVQKYGWGHSLALGGDLRRARAATPEGQPFIVHACEGVDELAREELRGLDRLGLLDSSTVLVHGLAIDDEGAALMRERGASLIICPSSNKLLFGKVPDMSVLSRVGKIALGSDSPLTAEGDLLDEVRFAVRFTGISASRAYQMVTTIPAAILGLGDGEGSIKESGVADLIAVRDTGRNPADTLQSLSHSDIELVMLGGRVQLASEAVLDRLPVTERRELEPLSAGGSMRWLRAPVDTLLREVEEIFGRGEVLLDGRRLGVTEGAEAVHAR
jgi:cytosine/adenosine deaminase-related metal-dependent hydrolase